MLLRKFTRAECLFLESRPGYTDYFMLYRSGPDAMVRTALTVIRQKLPSMGYDPMKHVQVLAPTKKGPLGTNHLNDVLQKP